MDCIYEETSSSSKAQKGRYIGKIVSVVYWISFVLAVFCLLNCVVTLSFGTPVEGASEEEISAHRFAKFLMGASAIFAVFFGLIATLCFLVKRQSGVSYDYVLVSGELRVAKIYGENHRKHVVCLQAERILQIGDVDGASFQQLENDPKLKKVFLTPNATPTEGKFFAYIYANDGEENKLFVLECKEELFVNLLKFIGRKRLASDYVIQSKKRKRYDLSG